MPEILMTHLQTGPDKSPERIAGMFNRIAQTYNLLNDVMTMGMHRRWKQAACRKLNLQPGGRVLDVCTGTGDLVQNLLNLVGPSGAITGLDFSAQMLDKAKTRFSNHSNIQWIQGDAMNLPFADNSFDGAVISFGLRNVQNPTHVLKEMCRVVRPGGWVVNLDTASDNKNPLFWLYFTWIMPVLGRILAHDGEAYQYLCQSTRAFATPVQIIAMMGGVGLESGQITYFGLGSVSCQSAQKGHAI